MKANKFIPDYRNVRAFIPIIFGLIISILIYYFLPQYLFSEDYSGLPAYPLNPNKVEQPIVSEIVQEEIIKDTEDENTPSIDEIYYEDEEEIAKVVMAEAKGEPLIGKVAVAVTVLNRCDAWDREVKSIIYEENQFATEDNPTEECLLAVEVAKYLRGLFPANMYWFSSDGWPNYGQKWIPIGNHNFSTDGKPIYISSKHSKEE